ncbi:MAG TPA: NAD(P)H-dependent oxidoreductase [Euzebyales bacterium]|nr:NAD(P)H-dependent oxidoreductase [Euzebyales bacterium]
MEPVNAAIIYYSATGNVHALACAAADGAEKAGARVRLRKVAELAPPEAISANPAWGEHLRDTADVAEASLDDLDWADAVLFGVPARFGNPASQLRAFIDGTGRLWRQGGLAGKVYSAFTASNTAHGGRSPPSWHWGTPSTTGAASSCPPATPTPSSSRPATPTGRPTWPAPVHPTT